MADEARYFALKRLAEYAIDKEEHPPVARFLSYQKSCFVAYAVVHDETSRGAVQDWANDNLEALREIQSWDYCELIAEPGQRAA